MSDPIDKNHPVGGVDYPRTPQKFDESLYTEDLCIAYWVNLRWPNGFICPTCGGFKGWMTTRRHKRCAGCQRQTSVTAGTILDGTREPLRRWFIAAWHMTNQKFSGSALGMQKVPGLGSYQTVWIWLQKLRRAMVRPGRDLLNGRVEVDETYVGGEEKGVSGRHLESRSAGDGPIKFNESEMDTPQFHKLRPSSGTVLSHGLTSIRKNVN